MVKVFEEKFPAGTQGTKKAGMYIDGALKSNLDVMKKALKEDWDGLVIVDGPEGAGKSVLTQQCAFYCDPTLNVSRIVFRPDEFEKAVLTAEKYQAIIFDEAFSGLASRKTMSTINYSIVSMLAEIRQKNLFIFIVMPSFFDMDKYVALWRSRCLLHVYADKFKRGFFRFYNYKKKKDMYVKGKKYYSYTCVQADFYGRFTNFYPCGKEEYKKKKENSLRSYLRQPRDTKLSLKREIYTDIIKRMQNNQVMKLNNNQIAELTGLCRQTVSKYSKPGLKVNGGDIL